MASQPDPPRILYMEDDCGLARLVQKRLERAGLFVDLAQDGQEGLSRYADGDYDVVAVDHNMPVYDGLQVIRMMASRGPLPPIVMITGGGNEEIAVSAMKLGAQDYVVKDVEGRFLELLPPVFERVLRQRRLQEEKERADQTLRETAAELEARNEELDAFAHTVAHDLKGPLSSLVGFAELLAQDYAKMRDEIRQEFHMRIVASAQKMSNIIDSLLLLSSVRKQEDVAASPLDMSAIVREAVERLAYLVEEHQAEIVMPASWPVAVGHAAWVEEVWVNYLSNAIKYGGRPPVVELGGEQLIEDCVRLWVRDNGEGIPVARQQILFTPFTRLGQAKAEGHGLGLSIVRRIVERLGGGVGVQSAPGTGSTFYFTLPSSRAALDTAASGDADSAGVAGGSRNGQ